MLDWFEVLKYCGGKFFFLRFLLWQAACKSCFLRLCTVDKGVSRKRTCFWLVGHGHSLVFVSTLPSQLPWMHGVRFGIFATLCGLLLAIAHCKCMGGHCSARWNGPDLFSPFQLSPMCESSLCACVCM